MCTKCMKSRRTRVSGIMKKGTSTMIISGAKVAAGYAGSRIVSNLPFVSANPYIRILAPIAGGIAVTSLMGKGGAEIATGMVVGGVINAVQQFLPGVATQAGLGAVPYKSLYSPGVSGNDGYPSVVLG